ncbi:shikimate kinase [Demequina oxidasica]|uniref:shikimate kinase n=1 Tax=Demequina oxidasica TaxID=676199 RepID=UPI000A006A74|nr:shikimate kinase [Demequina oxidasica]
MPDSTPGHPKPEPPKHPLVAQAPPSAKVTPASAGGSEAKAAAASAVGPRAVLIGPPGSGKSTVAKGLAREWGVQRRDTDDDIVRTSGKSISDIFLDDGEEAFRALEVAAVATALAEHQGVLSLGGGAILDESTQERLTEYAEAGGDVIFLDVSLSAAAPRVGLNNARPLLVGNPRRQWSTLMAERRPIYERLATRTVSTDHLNAKRIAHEIAGTEPTE